MKSVIVKVLDTNCEQGKVVVGQWTVTVEQFIDTGHVRKANNETLNS